MLQHRDDRLLVYLNNGLIVLVQENRASPVVSAQVWVKTGSIYEQEHVGAGLSHFLEHLISGGSTSTRTESQSNEILGQIGAQTNAATSLDTVRYYINTTSQHADQAIDLLSDWMQHSLITQEEFERERSVIQREFEMGQGEPGRILWKLTQQARYRSHPARHPTIGYIDEFLTISRDEIYDFYKRMYVPNNSVFVVVGDVDKQQVVDQIVNRWQQAQPGELPAVRFPIEAADQAPRTLVGTATVDQPKLRLAWSGTRLAGDGDYALDLLGVILGQGESSRLVRVIRDEQRKANAIDAYNLSFSWGEGFFGVDALVAIPPLPPNVRATAQQWRNQHIDQAREAILQQIQKVVEQGVTEEELTRAKRQTLAGVIMNAQSAQAMASRLARDLIGMKDPDYLNRYVPAVEAISAQDVQAAARRFLDPQRLISITLEPAPQDQSPPSLTRPADDTRDDQTRHEAVSLDNAVIVDALQSRTPEESAGESIQVDPIQRYVMPNGLRLLVGRNTAIPAVAIQLYQLGGLLADTPGREGLANAAALMQSKGTTTRDAQQISQQIESLGASLSTDCGNNTHYAAASCLKVDWPVVLELLADVTLNPTFPEDEWAKLQPRLLAAIDRQTDSWIGELRHHFREAYFGSQHPWSQSPLGRRAVVETLTPDDLRAFHHQHLGTSAAALAVFGDVNPDEVARAVERLFGAMPESPQMPVAQPTPLPPTPRRIHVKTNKALAAVQIGFGPGVARTNPDYPSLQVLAKVLSSFPAGWLEQALRGRGPGLVYAVGAGQFTGVVPGYFSVVYNTQPSSVAEALDRTLAVVEQARETQVDPATLARAKAKVLADEFLFKQTNSQRATQAALDELYGLGLDEPAQFRRQVEELDAQSLRVIAQTYLNNPVTIIMSHQQQPTPEQTPDNNSRTDPHNDADDLPTVR